MTKNKKAILSSDNMGWVTPSKIINSLGPIALDPCTWPDNPVGALTFYTIKDNGLVLPWSPLGLNYVNPPYGRHQILWVKKAIAEYLRDCESILLIPSRTDTKLWSDWIFPTAKAVCFVKGRIKFVDPATRKQTKNPSTFPSALVYYGKDVESFKSKISHLGSIVILR